MSYDELMVVSFMTVLAGTYLILLWVIDLVIQWVVDNGLFWWVAVPTATAIMLANMNW